MNSPKLSYRAEIDGLRAIAVVSVILYHAQIVLFGRDWFEGGFIGVDIFFVISGYLITRIILSELESKGSFSFLNFYERRARRILPMLFVVIFVSVPYAWQKLLPSDFVEYAESILTSLFFGSNFFFYFSTTEYGADSALLKPFLHTWSLGVEEQFYLVFPILAIIAFRYFRKHFLTIIVGLSLLSLQFAELMEVRNSELNFYLPFSRFWELAVGSMLAYRELNYKPSNENFASKSLPMLGLYLIVYSILFFDGETPHPSFHTLIPIVGVALIIGFASKDELIGKILGSKPFVWMGLISYSAYLWHFPIFAFSRMEKEPTNYDKFEWIALTLVLSVISYLIVERSIRNRKIVGSYLFWGATFLSILILSSSLFYAINLFNLTKTEQNSLFFHNALLDEGGYLAQWRFVQSITRLDGDFDGSDRPKALIIGNSHATDYINVLNASKLAEKIDFGVIVTKGHDDNYQVSCFAEFIKNGDLKCEQGLIYSDLAKKFEIADVIILATRWYDKDVESLPTLLGTLRNKHHKKVVVVENAFELSNGPHPLRQFVKKMKRRPSIEELQSIRAEWFNRRASSKLNPLNNTLRAIAQQEGAHFVSREDLYCNFDSSVCDIFTDEGFLIVWDYGHLSTFGATHLGSNLNTSPYEEIFRGF